MRYLLDTNSLSYFFRGEGFIEKRLRACTPVDVGIPAPVLYESRYGMLRLMAGVRRTKLIEALDRVVGTLEIVPFDQSAAEAAARIRAILGAAGEGIGPLDVQIAGIALARSATLVTRNIREFSRVGGLLIENWYDAQKDCTRAD